MAHAVVEERPPLHMGLPLSHGKVAMWLFLVTEIMFFTGLIGTYIVLRNGSRDWATPHQVHLIEWLGALNTFVLICSSLSVVLAHSSISKGDVKKTLGWIGITLALGFVFLVVKAIEYKGKFDHHILPGHVAYDQYEYRAAERKREDVPYPKALREDLEHLSMEAAEKGLPAGLADRVAFLLGMVETFDSQKALSPTERDEIRELTKSGKPATGEQLNALRNSLRGKLLTRTQRSGLVLLLDNLSADKDKKRHLTQPQSDALNKLADGKLPGLITTAQADALKSLLAGKPLQAEQVNTLGKLLVESAALTPEQQEALALKLAGKPLTKDKDDALQTLLADKPLTEGQQLKLGELLQPKASETGLKWDEFKAKLDNNTLTDTDQVKLMSAVAFLTVEDFEEVHLPYIIPQGNIWTSCYFVMTGFHAIHVIGGLVVFVIILLMGAFGRLGLQHESMIELTGLYWHFVDIVWIFLFPLLYLV
jgi:cytochrome c oxidase subunit 3